MCFNSRPSNVTSAMSVVGCRCHHHHHCHGIGRSGYSPGNGCDTCGRRRLPRGMTMMHDRNPDKLLAAALNYASNPQRPIKVFPIKPGEKKSRLAAKYAKDGANWGATSDLELIKKHWRQWPNSNIGLPTGAANGFFVVEVDTKEGHPDLV